MMANPKDLRIAELEVERMTDCAKSWRNAASGVRAAKHGSRVGEADWGEGAPAIASVGRGC